MPSSLSFEYPYPFIIPCTIASIHFTTKQLFNYLFNFFSLPLFSSTLSNPLSRVAHISILYIYLFIYFSFQSLIFQNKFSFSNNSPKFEYSKILFSKIIFFFKIPIFEIKFSEIPFSNNLSKFQFPNSIF